MAGGREATVGVGGLLLGGGTTFYTCRVGFACGMFHGVRSSRKWSRLTLPDNVLNYEVVLADGSIINASESEHADLFRTLKGSGNNFGIVTRFDMSTFSFNKIWDGIRYLSEDCSRQAVDALCNLTSSLNSEPDSHALFTWHHPYQAQEHSIFITMTSLDGVDNEKSLKPLLDIPGQGEMKMTTVGAKVETFAIPSGKE